MTSRFHSYPFQPKEPAMTCPTAFTYEEAAALWREAQDLVAQTERLRAERDTADLAVTSWANDCDTARRERDTARAEVERLTEALHHERCNTRYSKADRDEDRTKRETLKADLANAREAAAADHAAMLEARAERDTLARALAAVRAVVAMVPTGGEA